MARATSSFPVPLSPVTSTAASVPATVRRRTETGVETVHADELLQGELIDVGAGEEFAVDVTVSVGVAAWPQDADSANALIEAADRAGGNIRTEREDGFTVEWGPNGFLDNVEATPALVRRLGLQDEVQKADDAAAISAVLTIASPPGGVDVQIVKLLRAVRREETVATMMTSSRSNSALVADKRIWSMWSLMEASFSIKVSEAGT